MQVKTHQHEADDDTDVLGEEVLLTVRLKVEPTNDFLFFIRAEVDLKRKEKQFYHITSPARRHNTGRCMEM